MASGLWIMIGVIVVCAIISNMVVTIVKTAKSGGGKKMTQRIDDLEADLDDAMERIKVLEKIVTDEKYDLSRQIDDLKDSGTG